MIERRHQVFVSSTFSDLKNERAEIIQALLELDCFPAGMELFPATSATAWELIKGVIDDSDYYCLVIGGRYGSVDAAGIGYTEKEYDYALATSKPIMVFLHKAPGTISLENTEKSDDGRRKLEAFRAKVEAAHHCKYWASPEELGGQVSRSLVVLRRSFPSSGWVPGEFAADEAITLENANLKARVAQLEANLLIADKKINKKSLDNLAAGSDKYAVGIAYLPKGSKEYEHISVSVTWDTILTYVGPTLLGECAQDEFDEKLSLCFSHALGQVKKETEGLSVVVPYVYRDEIMVQLRALGYMTHGVKRRAVADQKVYWKLTEQGEEQMIQVQAVKRRITQLKDKRQ